MKITKRLMFFILILIVSVILYSFIAVIESYLTEWTSRRKTYNVTYPISITENSISEIEKQVEAIILKKYENAYLSEIIISTDTDEGFNHFTEGTIIFTYCHKLDSNIIYRYDRFVLCEARVDLKSKQIQQIHIYGNNQIGGLKKIESYPEIVEIRNDLYHYCENQEQISKPYTVNHSYIHITHYGIASASFTLQQSDGSAVNIKNVLGDIGQGHLDIIECGKSARPPITK